MYFNVDHIELILAEMSMYENPTMSIQALSVLNRIYGQRRELISHFEKNIIAVEGKTYLLF